MNFSLIYFQRDKSLIPNLNLKKLVKDLIEEVIRN